MRKRATPQNNSAAFAAWAILSKPLGMSVTEVEAALVKAGVQIKPPATSTPTSTKTTSTGELKIGELVYVDGSKCTNPNNSKICASLAYGPSNPTYFVVVKINKPQDIDELCSVVISPVLPTGEIDSQTYVFEAANPVRIAGILKGIATAQKKNDLAKILALKEELREKSLSPHEGLGLYRVGFDNISKYKKYLELYESSDKFIIVYERAGKAPIPEVRAQFSALDISSRNEVMRTSGDFQDIVEDFSSYSSRFYMGPLKYAAHNATGELYLSMDTKRSRGVDSMMNPATGKIYFIGKVTEISDAWKKDLRARLQDLAKTP
jgi:hypothetical protein